jgi:hypothetical protein
MMFENDVPAFQNRIPGVNCMGHLMKKMHALIAARSFNVAPLPSVGVFCCAVTDKERSTAVETTFVDFLPRPLPSVPVLPSTLPVDTPPVVKTPPLCAGTVSNDTVGSFSDKYHFLYIIIYHSNTSHY